MLTNVIPKNEKRSFDSLQSDRLGNYIYALRDPRDNKIFYVGQGSGNRVFQHFNEAQEKLQKGTSASSKVIRILDIWKNFEDVSWDIIAHGLPRESLGLIESGIIDALSISQNGQCLNENRGPHSSILGEDDVEALGAKVFNPKEIYRKIFLFPAHNTIANSPNNIYEATRASWKIAKRNRVEGSYAVGIKGGISVGGYKISGWEGRGEKQAFVGDEESALLNYDWKYIISCSMGYWQRGNYLIAEFDGRGRFRVTHGRSEKEWLTIPESIEM